MSTELRWWWLSFADDDAFRGVTIVRASSFITAVDKARALGINPGGQVLGFEIPPDVLDLYPDQYRNRLLDRDVALALGENCTVEEISCN